MAEPVDPLKVSHRQHPQDLRGLPIIDQLPSHRSRFTIYPFKTGQTLTRIRTINPPQLHHGLFRSLILRPIKIRASSGHREPRQSGLSFGMMLGASYHPPGPIHMIQVDHELGEDLKSRVLMCARAVERDSESRSRADMYLVNNFQKVAGGGRTVLAN